MRLNEQLNSAGAATPPASVPRAQKNAIASDRISFEENERRAIDDAAEARRLQFEHVMR